MPGIVSPADLRYLKSIFRDFGLRADPAARLFATRSTGRPGASTSRFPRAARRSTRSAAWAAPGPRSSSAPPWDPAQDRRGAAGRALRRAALRLAACPSASSQTDRFFEALETLTGRRTPAEHQEERGRLIDSYVDAHKYVFGKRAIVYGEQDLVVGLASLLAEVGIHPVLCASGAQERPAARSDSGGRRRPGRARSRCWKASISPRSKSTPPAEPDLVIGSSKGYGLARRLDIPLIRVGFPIHDRIDGPRLVHLGYRGAQQLFDRIANALIEPPRTRRRWATRTCEGELNRSDA